MLRLCQTEQNQKVVRFRDRLTRFFEQCLEVFFGGLLAEPAD